MLEASPFDTLAETYDADFSSSAIGLMQRKRVWKWLVPLLNESGRSLNILEINCGTGEDAIRLASMGHRVIATDASAAMIAKANEKISGSAIPPTGVQFMTSTFDQLNHLFAGQKFDLIFSNFGGLNCVDKAALIRLREYLSALLTANGNLFFVVMGRCCLWEIAHYSFRVEFKSAFRRFKRSVDFKVKGRSMPVYYYSPHSLKKIFSPSYRLLNKRPIGLFIPPSYLESRFASKPGELLKLYRKEVRFSAPFFSAFADHYCVIFKKTGSSS